MSRVCTLAMFVLLMGCGAKERNSLPTENAACSRSGIFVSRQGHFVVRPSTQRWVPGEDNKIVYRILTGELKPPSPEFSFQFNHRMPTMPHMIIPKTKPVVLGPGHIEVVYEIAHGGFWEFEIRLYQNNTLVDTLVYTVTIPD